MEIQRDMLEKYNILITGIGCPGGASIIKHIKNNLNCNIIGIDSDLEYCATKFYVDKYYQCLRANESGFFEEILDIIQKNNITHIISLVTDELSIFSRNKHVFEKLNVKLRISSYDDIGIVTNKLKLYEKLHFFIETPKYRYCSIREIADHFEYFNYPDNKICLKQTSLDGARGFRILSEKEDRLKQMLTEKPYNTYISYGELTEILKTSSDNYDVLICEYLGGKEYTVDTFVDNGNLISWTIRERIKLKDHISFVGKTVKNSYIDNQIIQINKVFKFDGSIGYQFKEGNTGYPKLLECNARLQGGSILSCNDNFDYILANLGHPTVKSGSNTKMMRYFSEVYERDGKLFT